MTLTATVTPSAATGAATFNDGETTLGTDTLSAGIASLVLSTLAAGSHFLTAVYSGDAKYAKSTSGTLTLIVSSALPLITSLTPTSATATGAAFTLCANGTSFMPGAIAQWSGSGLPTAFVNVVQVCASVPASLIAIQGSAIITIGNPGGVSSNGVAFPINAPVPSITPCGIVPVYGSACVIQSGSWISIFGTSLANGSYIWNANFPTYLGGVTVTINNKLAYLWYVSPSQINCQAPDDTATGTVSVVVTTPFGSAGSTVTLSQYAPSFILSPGSDYAAGVILTPNGSGAYGNSTYDLLGPIGHFSFNTRPVRAGEALELYGVGFGSTSPAVPPGQTFSGVAPATTAVRVSVGGLPADVLFSGVTDAGHLSNKRRRPEYRQRGSAIAGERRGRADPRQCFRYCAVGRLT